MKSKNLTGNVAWWEGLISIQEALGLTPSTGKKSGKQSRPSVEHRTHHQMKINTANLGRIMESQNASKRLCFPSQRATEGWGSRSTHSQLRDGLDHG